MRALPLSIGTIHFVGIGGIGMSGIAEVLHTLGYPVQGSDIADCANVRRLREAGIPVAIGHDAAQSGRCPGGRGLHRGEARQPRGRRRPRAASSPWCGGPRCWPS